ncbi:MAG: glycosyltransferase [Chloroflexota bacterium]
MRITILAVGSRGDMQPFTALGLGLKEAGHNVRIAAATDYEGLVRPYGLDYAPLVGSIRELMDRQAVTAILDGADNPLRFVKGMMDTIRPLVARLIADCYAASQDADALVVSTLGLYAGYDVAETLGIPVFTAHLHPDVATRYYPHVFAPVLPSWFPCRAQYNRLSFGVSDAAYWAMIFGSLNQARRDIFGLPPLTPMDCLRRTRRPLRPVLHAYSPHMTRTPPDWGRNVHVTGYWFLDSALGWEPDPALVRFLEAGPPPVYVGFGSALVGSDPDAVTRTVLGALQRTGQRGILMTGWGDLGNITLPESVLRVEQVPHDWLFPRVRAVVCHGGAGTTAAALRAGIPPVLVPFYGDMHFWAQRLERMGLGPRAVNRRQLTEESLAAAIDQAVNDTSIRARVAIMARRIACERGVERGVEIIGGST